VLKGSVIAFVTAGYSGKRFIFEKAHELGVRHTVVEQQAAAAACRMRRAAVTCTADGIKSCIMGL
jgi:hypothetical protein